ncbi:phosphate ABC transporter permease subunit PstC [Leptolyngbyaceae cyanobacterium CCMR0082]|uniref:Phosphate transport system permease protein n=1 Tax=Adonisia turfae CCMR0082 TaxID=2304604 RepID=A0A6M0S126_9CYAN|nr:phosphate ABC transporter permease subunit PstC [Adonisia turfae]NEZ61642.1 phosphate ABC transporter permease subunit PstC [Adonisia turfae CCMR0082]
MYPLISPSKGNLSHQVDSSASLRRAKRHDWLLLNGLRLLAGITAAIGVLITVFVLKESLPALQSIGILRFFGDEAWYPLEGQFNLVPILLGTVLIALGGIAIATPLGLLSALFCQFYAPKLLASIYQRLLELLAGIPSVVYGFWGLVVLVPKINQIHPPGQSLLAGILILSLMILPTVALLSKTSLGDVPGDYLKGAEALSLSRWTILSRIVLPTARSGLITAIVLATGRALGETMAVLMVCGNVVQIPNSVFAPVRSLAANIALEMAYATMDHRSVLFVSGLVLLGLVGLLVMITSVLGAEEQGRRHGV